MEGRDKMKKLLIILVGILLLTGCDLFELSEADKVRQKQYERDGEQLAINHIATKYGFSPKVKKVEAETQRDSLGPLYLTGNVFVTMEYNGRTFFVKVPIDNKYGEQTGDTYQNDVIEKAIIRELESILGKKLLYYYPSLDSKWPTSSRYYIDYFNGTEIEKFTTEFKVGVTAPLELDEQKETRLKNLMSKSFSTVFVFKTEKDYNTARKSMRSLYDEPGPIFLAEKYTKSYDDDDKLIRYTFDVKEDDIILGYKDYENKKIYSFTNYELKPIDSEILQKMFATYERKPKVVLNAMSLGNQKLSFVYVSKNYYNNHRNLQAIFYCGNNDGMDREIFEPQGDYYYSRVFSTYDCNDGYVLFVN